MLENIKKDFEHKTMFNRIRSTQELRIVPARTSLGVIVSLQMSRFLQQAEIDGQLDQILAEGAISRERVLFLDVLADNPKASDPSKLTARNKIGFSQRFSDRSIYYDAASSFVLAFQNSPLAVIAFDQENNYLDVKQIQGVKDQMSPNEVRRYQTRARNGDNTVFLREFGNWELSLLRLVEEYAKSIGIAEVRVLPADKKLWRRLKTKKAQAHYDRTAQSLGYAYDPLLSRFIKTLQPDHLHLPLFV